MQNADAAQLETVEQLIEFYDRAEPPDSQTARQMEFFHLQYATAETVVERVKEVFVDLLTPNDKARQPRGEERPQQVYNYNFGGSDALVKVPKYKGQLLITADATSNTVVVLAPGYVLEPVKDMIQQLDRSARTSSTVQVLKLDGMNPAQVQSTITKILGTPGQASASGERGDRGFDRRRRGPRQKAWARRRASRSRAQVAREHPWRGCELRRGLRNRVTCV